MKIEFQNSPSNGRKIPWEDLSIFILFVQKDSISPQVSLQSCILEYLCFILTKCQTFLHCQILPPRNSFCDNY